MAKCVKTKTVGIGYRPEFYFWTCMLCVKYVHQISSYFLACETHQKAGGHMLTANSDSLEADRSGRPVRLVCPVVIRVGFVLFSKFLYKPTWRGVRISRPINIKAKAAQAPTGPSRARVSRSLRFSASHRSDRSVQL